MTNGRTGNRKVEPDWTQAACRGHDTNLWFPARGKIPTEAIAICDTCPIKQQCDQYAMDHGIKVGVWGGVTELTRKKRRGRALQQARKQAQQALEQTQLEALEQTQLEQTQQAQQAQQAQDTKDTTDGHTEAHRHHQTDAT